MAGVIIKMTNVPYDSVKRDQEKNTVLKRGYEQTKMAGYSKRKLVDLITTLQETNDLLKNECLKNRQPSMEILKQCQDIAMMVGTQLETGYQAGGGLIRLLEDYCEMVYQMCLAVTDTNQCVKMIKKARGVLTKISDKLQYELPDDKKKIVFLPYKASMWDTMESIWEAAVNRNDCEVYVIPAPYYEKQSDGNLGTIHWEGDAYPDYVPVRKWTEIRLKEMHPDIIFIHNPYDNDNFVTTVHPEYYSSSLRNMTNQLVWLPYAISSKEEVSEALVCTPGVLYSHYVVLQSEAIKDGFIKYYKKLEERNHFTGYYGKAEEKFLALGSAKIDKAVCLDAGGFRFPEEWARKRGNNDHGKVVVLLNTSLTALLNNSESYLDKLERDLEMLKRRREDILLLWRPHPLSDSAYQAMRPHLIERYRRVVKKYRAENWGIFDSGADLYRAVAFSDIYYGDWSSVATIFQCRKQMVILRNPAITDNDKADIDGWRIPAKAPAVKNGGKVPEAQDWKHAVTYHQSYVLECAFLPTPIILDLLIAEGKEETKELEAVKNWVKKYAVIQIVNREKDRRPADIGIYDQDGRCGERILNYLLDMETEG